MDSLLANYGPSDDDEEEEPEEKQKPSFDFNPPNRLSSLLASLPPPKPSSSSSSISYLLPPPKSQNSVPSKPSAKKVIQFKPPLNPSLFKSSNLDDDDDDDDDVKRKPSKELSPSSQNTTIKNSLPFFLPPPKHSLCLAPPPSSSSGRRGLVETTNPVIQDQEKGKFENHLSKGGDSVDGLSSSTSTRVPGNDNYVENAANGSSYTSSDWVATNDEYATYENYGNYEGNLESVSSSSFAAQENYSDIGSYRNYQSNRGDGAMAMTSSETLVENVGRVGKRGRNEVPTEMVEVKQDELIGNRPREDQVKLTGIAFGPAYQPVSSSTKAKPTKLQKRKHQIGSLYFDMKQKEMELAERRARGFLTKAETQAKYGW